MIVGVSALIMSFGMPAIGGVNQAAATTLFAMFCLVCVGQSISSHSAARNRAAPRMDDSRFLNWSGCRAIRPIVAVFFATSCLSGLTPYEFFGSAFWIGFVLHLIAAEVWIQRTRPVGESWTANARNL